MNDFWLHCRSCAEPIIKFIGEAFPVSGDVIASADYDHDSTDSEGTPGSKYPRCPQCGAMASFMLKDLYPLGCPKYRETKRATALEF